MAQGTLYIVSAPSGAGKSVAWIQAFIKTQPLYDTQVSCFTYHARRVCEVRTVSTLFRNHDEFKTMIGRECFWTREVFGTLALRA